MSCCAPGAEAALSISGGDPASSRLNEMLLASRDLGDGPRQTDLSVPGVHCAACIASVERAAVGLARRRIRPREPLHEKGHRELARGRGSAARSDRRPAAPPATMPIFSRRNPIQRDPEYSRLVRALAVAGFSRDEHHAPVGICVVGRRWGHAPGIPPDLGRTCACRLFSTRAGFSSRRHGRALRLGDAPTWTCRFRSV